jgi:glycosyltransferase involved in cell wall biosynthesis
VGGAADDAYWRQVQRFVDGLAVVSTVVDPDRPSDEDAWRSSREIAELCNRARLFVSASPQESFGLALIEAMACGTTCVVNGDYWGFAERDLRPNVYGNVTGKRGSVVELAVQALRDGVHIDASAWARKYSLRATRDAVLPFIDARI